MKTILIVEDNVDVREEIADILKMEGYSTLEAENGKKGLETLQTVLPDLIISDIMMPEMDGFSFMKRLKQKNGTKHIPVVLLSAVADKQNIRQGMQMGADDYLTKPMDTNDMLTVISNIIKKDESIRQKFENLRYNITSTLPHELRTPLNGIIGFSDYLRQVDISKRQIDINKIAEHIYQSGHRLYRLIENYLLYSKLVLTEDKTSLQKDFSKTEIISVKAVIQRILSKKQEEYPLHQEPELKIQETEIVFHPMLFETIVNELLDNAFKFSDPNSAPAEIELRPTNTGIDLSIKNYGRGMTEEQIADIGAFMQFDRNHYEQQGSGLGLAIIKKICEIYDGSLRISGIFGNFITANIKLKSL